MTTDFSVEYRDWSSNIPVDVQEQILLKLGSIEDFKRFGAVCKQWRLAAAYYKCRALQHSQWLVEKKRAASGFTVHLPLADFPFNIRVDVNEMMRGASILCSKDGWLLMNKGAYKVFFFSFFSKSIIKLPNLPKAGPKFRGFTFTSSPTSKDCLVFGLSPHSYSLRLYLGASISVGDKNWTWKTFESSEYYNFSNPVYHRGKFGCLSQQGSLAVFPRELDSCAFLGPTFSIPDWAIVRSHLLEVDGELFAVFPFELCWGICVCKWDDSNENWHKVNDIGDYVFCVSDRTSYAKKTTDQHMRNKVYFRYLDENSGVFYCLKSEKFQSLRNDFFFSGILNTQAVLESCWMDPTQHSTPEWIEKSADCFVLSVNDDDDDVATADIHDEKRDGDEDDALYHHFWKEREVYYHDDDDYDDDYDDDTKEGDDEDDDNATTTMTPQCRYTQDEEHEEHTLYRNFLEEENMYDDDYDNDTTGDGDRDHNNDDHNDDTDDDREFNFMTFSRSICYTNFDTSNT